jgi:amidase
MSGESALQASLARIDAREREVHAWTHIASNFGQPNEGPLHGLPIGVKDVIDTADMPTEYGSPIYKGHRPKADAEVVRRLKRAGAIVLGKTVTTEFAFQHAGATRNPHNLACTPGGSSSGSAAAVADGMVPVALGTQTGGSIIRPAAYCGVLGYKPAFDRFPTAGLKFLAPSLDTIGIIARTVDDIARVSAVLSGQPKANTQIAKPRFALCRTPYAAEAEPQMHERLDAVAKTLARAGAQVRELELPASFADLNQLHRVIMAHETARSMAHEWQTARGQLSTHMAGFIERGLSISDDAAAAARVRVAACKEELPALLEDGELILTFSAAGEAPVGLESTGNAVFNRLWTLLDLPCLAVPAGRGARGLPLGVQLVGGPESLIFAVAAWTVDLNLGEKA